MIRLAFSPCPNDTALFYGWISGKLHDRISVISCMGDIQYLNQMALQREVDVCKVSFFCLGKVLSDYVLLPVGSALGDACGPKIISKKPYIFEELQNKRIAIPGKETTAHLLFDLFNQSFRGEKVFCRYNEICSLLADDKVDAGVIIHETRFTFQEQGFYEIADLGILWHQKTSSPLPLGCLVARRSLPSFKIAQIVTILRESYLYFKAFPLNCMEFIQMHSQEKNLEVIQNHIALYMNDETYQLSSKGIKSIEAILNYGLELGHFSQLAKELVFHEQKTNSFCTA